MGRRAYSDDLRGLVVAEVAAGASRRSAAQRFKVSASSAIRWVDHYAETGSISPRRARKPRSPLEPHASWLLELIAQEPDLTLAEIAQGIEVNPKLVWAPADVLKANNISAWNDMPVWIPGEGRTFGFHRRDLSRAVAKGLTYRPLPLTASDTLAWFRTLPSERQGKLRAGLTSEREAELLAKLRA